MISPMRIGKKLSKRDPKMSKVYVINRGGHDFTNAARFGELVYLSEGRIPPFSVANMYRTFSEHLSTSSPTDYILLAGLPVMQSVACSIFSYLHGRLNLLLFKDGRYIERTIILSELLKGNRDEREESKSTKAPVRRVQRHSGQKVG